MKNYDRYTGCKIPWQCLSLFKNTSTRTGSVFAMHYFYGTACSYINDAVTSLGNNLHDGVNIDDSWSISLDLKTF